MNEVLIFTLGCIVGFILSVVVYEFFTIRVLRVIVHRREQK